MRATEHLIAADPVMAAERAMTQHGGHRPLTAALKAPEISGALR